MFDKLTDMQFQKIRDIIYQESGMHFSDINRPILESRLRDRLRKTEIDEIDKYYNFIKSNDEEMKQLLDAVTTNLTSFFRNKVHFEGFVNGVIPDLKQKKTNKTIRVWSAACSTGEEPYSIAMVLLDKLGPGWKIEIVASDISFNVLMTAKEGFYKKPRVTGVPEDYLRRFMIETEDGYIIKDEVKKLITFDYHNLKNIPVFREFDIVFCRNVIIYFDAKAQQSVINKIYDVMSQYSYLFIGHSESLFGMDTNFKFTKLGETCLYMKKKGE